MVILCSSCGDDESDCTKKHPYTGEGYGYLCQACIDHFKQEDQSLADDVQNLEKHLHFNDMLSRMMQ